MDFISFELLLIFILLLASAFFSSSETALTSVPKSYILYKESKGVKSASILNKMLNTPNNLLTSLLVGNNIANIFFTTLLTTSFIKVFGDKNTFLLATGITFIILVFAEILPKTYAFNNSNKLSLFFAPLIYILVIILKPITYIFIKINDFMLLLSKPKNAENASISLDNLRGAIEMLQRSNNQAYSEEKQMLHSILDLSDLTVAEIMNHRKNVFCVDIEDSPQDIIDSLIQCNYSRVPIIEGDIENIIGILNVKEIFREYQQNGYNFNIKDLIRKPHFIPDSTIVLSLLSQLKEGKQRLSLIVDEYGSFMGILTFSDIIDEITGEIETIEHPSILNKIQKDKDSYIVDGDLTIRDLNRHNNWNLPDKEFTTIAGLILYETGKIPNVGNIFIFHNFKFTILQKKRHQIMKIKISKI